MEINGRKESTYEQSGVEPSFRLVASRDARVAYKLNDEGVYYQGLQNVSPSRIVPKLL
jgi:hypothetical protein